MIELFTYYQELRDLDYTGSVENFMLLKMKQGKRLRFLLKIFSFQKLKEYSNFRTEMTKSKLPEIIKNIALIYVMQKRNDLAIGAIKDARAANPLDVGLYLQRQIYTFNWVTNKSLLT